MLCLLQATLRLLESLVNEVHSSNQADSCCNILQALNAPALMDVLCKRFVSSLDTAYGTRTAALGLLTSLFVCVRQTWSSNLDNKQPGSMWDPAVLACLASVVRHVCMPNHDTRLGGMRGKQLLRQGLQCLQQLVVAVPVQLWSEEWQQVRATYPAVDSSKCVWGRPCYYRSKK